MADTGKTALLVYILTFWSLVTMFTFFFQEDINNTTILTENMGCLKPNSNLPDTICENQNNDLFTGINKIFNIIWNVTSEIPILNIFTPLLRVLTMGYTSALPVWLTIILDLLAVYTGLIIYGLIREG